jgi:hypothetical protein
MAAMEMTFSAALGPRRWWALLRLLACLAMLATASPRAAAQQSPPVASVAASAAAVELGDSFIYQITIDGATQVAPPTLPVSPDWTVEFIGGQDQSSRSSFTINGRTTVNNTLKYVMQWRITPRKLGPSRVDGFTMPVGADTVSVPALQFRVNEAQANPNYTLVLDSEIKAAYVGEPVRMKLVWTLGADAKSATFSGPDGGQTYDVAALDPRPPQQRGLQIQRGEPYAAVPFLNGQAVISRSQTTLNGRSVPQFTLDLIVTPRKTGTIEIGPYRVVCDEVVGQRRRSFFDSPFDDMSQTKRSVVTSNAFTLEVKPLPEQGRPADFSGLIGRYSLEASSANAEANVGDPVPLTLTIKGPEPLDSLKAPDLEIQSEFASRFKAAPEGWEAVDAAKSGGVPGQRVFNTTVRPKSDAVTAIPAIRLPYFDTATSSYEVATSTPIPLRVKASRQITAADAQGGSSSGGALRMPSGSPVTLTDGPAGIGANSESLDSLVDQRVSLFSLAATPQGIAFLTLPPLSLAAALLLTWRQRSTDPRRAATRQALSAARSLLKVAQTHGELATATKTALSPFLNIARDSITASDPAESNLPGRAASLARQLLLELEAAAYDGRVIDLQAARSRALMLIEELSHA